MTEWNINNRLARAVRCPQVGICRTAVAHARNGTQNVLVSEITCVSWQYDRARGRETQEICRDDSVYGRGGRNRSLSQKGGGGLEEGFATPR